MLILFIVCLAFLNIKCVKNNVEKQEKVFGEFRKIMRKENKRLQRMKAEVRSNDTKLTRQELPFIGNDCEYIKLKNVVQNSGCSSGHKFVIGKDRNSDVRKQFLIMNDEPILGFVKRGKKFSACASYTDVTSNVGCKEIPGLASVDLSVRQNRQDISFNGNDCEYIKLANIVQNSNCKSGDKYVIKQDRNSGIRAQFLITDNEPILGFRKRGEKFHTCSSFADVTSNVQCKEVSGLANVDLKSTGILIAGGRVGAVELFNPGANSICSLPNLPEDRFHHVMANNLACGGRDKHNSNVGFFTTHDDCVEFTEGTWKHSNYSLTFTIPNSGYTIYIPTYWKVDDGIYFLGGEASGTTQTHFLKFGGEFENNPFSLEYYIW